MTLSRMLETGGLQQHWSLTNVHSQQIYVAAYVWPNFGEIQFDWTAQAYGLDYFSQSSIQWQG